MGATQPGRNVQSLAVAGAFAVGAVVGGAAVTALASRASVVYAQMLRVTLAVREGERARDAWAAGDPHSALLHAGCALQAESGADPLQYSPPPWPRELVAAGLVVGSGTRWAVDGEAALPGPAAAHAQVGAAWERLGQAARAEREFSMAARLAGSADLDEWRRAGRAMLGDPLPPPKAKLAAR